MKTKILIVLLAAITPLFADNAGRTANKDDIHHFDTEAQAKAFVKESIKVTAQESDWVHATGHSMNEPNNFYAVTVLDFDAVAVGDRVNVELHRIAWVNGVKWDAELIRACHRVVWRDKENLLVRADRYPYGETWVNRKNYKGTVQTIAVWPSSYTAN